MALSLEINGTDYTAKWRPYESHWSRRAFMGESAGETEIVIDDDDGTINHADFATYKIVRIIEDASGASYEMFKGRITNKRLGRGPLRVGVAMRWVIQVADANYELRGIRIADSHRPEESDRERFLAYRFGYLNGSASTNPNARISTTIDGAFVSSDDLITLPAEDYRDTYPDQLFRQISEISAKTFFVFTDGDGVDHLYYASHDDTQLLSDIIITDDGTADDVDSYAPNVSDGSGYHDGLQVITGGGVRYGDDEFLEMDDVAGGEADHDKFEEHFTDEFLVNEASAVDFLQSVVASRSNEEFTFTLTWQMAAEHAHRIMAGYVTSLRVASANLPTPTNQRATQVTHRPLYPDADGNARYEITADFGIPRGRPFQRNLRRRPNVTPRPSSGGETVAVDPGGNFLGGGSVASATLTAAHLDAGLLSGATLRAGDFVIVEASTDTAGTTPTVATGFTGEGTGYAVGGLTTMGGRISWNILDASDIASGSWAFTNANTVDFRMYRGIDPADPVGTLFNINDLATTDPDGQTPAISGIGTDFLVATFLQTDSAVTIGEPDPGTNLSVGQGGTQWYVNRINGHDGETAHWDTLGTGAPSSLPERIIDWAGSSYWTCTSVQLNIDPAPPGETVPGDRHEEMNGESTAVFAPFDHGHAVRRVAASSPPDADDDSAHGFDRHDLWYVVDNYDDPTTVSAIYVLLDPSEGAAVWYDISPGGVDLTAINFLVGTATGLLSGEIAVGTTPGGELGGTWASPTVDATHSGSAHLALGTTAGTAAEGDHTHSGSDARILLADGRSTPFAFEDMLQMDDGSDFMWSD